MLPNNCLQVLLDEDDGPYLEDHWLTEAEMQAKKQMILSQTQPTQKKDQLYSSESCPSRPATHQEDNLRKKMKIIPPLPINEPDPSPGDA